MCRQLVLLGTVLLSAASLRAQPNDGRAFDPGHALTAPSPHADSALHQLSDLLGVWRVEVETWHPPDTTAHRSEGLAEVTLMNRGHGFMERRHTPDYDAAGTEEHALTLISHIAPTQQWMTSEASSYTESILVSDGAFEAPDRLVVRQAVRRAGGTRVVLIRTTYQLEGPDAFSVEVDQSITYGEDGWRPVERRHYTRASEAGRRPRAAGEGSPAEGLPPEARQFDFIVGEFDARQRMLGPEGWVEFDAITTGAYALGGHAILETAWYDSDPNYPDAAMTALRLYNRAEHRWESLFIDNISNTHYRFGGRWEDGRMALHPFDVRLNDRQARYIFHAIQPDRYDWYCELSTDRGATFTTTWTINATRRAD
ncbi:MAG: DUF1579 family protein [Bacteroidota bacterium]